MNDDGWPNEDADDVEGPPERVEEVAHRAVRAIGGDQVAIVLHRLSPIVHEVLIDIVLVDKRLTGVVGEQVFGHAEAEGKLAIRTAALQRLVS